SPHIRAVVVTASDESDSLGVICERGFISLHCSDRQSLARACVTLNSKFALYFLLLTSGRPQLGHFEPIQQDFLALPIPDENSLCQRALQSARTFDDLDRLVLDAFDCNEADRILVGEAVE